MIGEFSGLPRGRFPLGGGPAEFMGASDPYPHLLLVVLTNAAKARLAELEWNEEELDEELDFSAGSILLYNWRPKPGASPTIALPVKGGAGALLLKRQKEGDHYFVCVDIARFGQPAQLSKSGDTCHNLPPRVRGKIVAGRAVMVYLPDALDCDEIEREVGGKKPWRPHAGGGVEERKWGAYLRLHKAACEKRRMTGLPAKDIAVKGGKLTAVLDLSAMPAEEDLEEKIRGARGELFKFNLSPLTGGAGDRKSLKLGNLLGVGKVRDGLRLTFNLDSGFGNSLASEAQSGKFYAEAEVEAVQSPDGEVIGAADASVSLSPGKLPDNAQRREFYESGPQRVPVFSCRADVDDDGAWVFAPASVVPSRLYLHADFIGDLSQIHIMRGGLRRITEHPLWQVLVEGPDGRVAKLPDDEESVVQFADDCRLNDGQRDAVRKALRAKELLLIWGPPGTGKTEVIAEIARQEAARGGKTLVVSQANLAVDNAIARLHGSPGVWPLRIAKDDWQPEEDDKSKVPMRDTAGGFFADWLQRRLREARNEAVREEVVALRKEFMGGLGELRKQGKDAQTARTFPQLAMLYHRRLNVVGATLMESGKTVHIGKGDGGRRAEVGSKLTRVTGIPRFSTVIVDEVSKAMPPELFLPVPLGERLILVGDHRQLPPVIKDPVSGEDRSLEEWAEEAGVPVEELNMEPTLFERLWKKHDGEHTREHVRAMLTTQYRMHTDIERLIQPFYTDSEGKLECGLDEQQLRGLSVASGGFFAGRHVAWIRTGRGDEESLEGTSRLNQGEVRIVGHILKALSVAGRKDKKMSVGVITFYGAQLRALCEKYDNKEFRSKFPGGLIFGTVDRFQGRECDVIICSLVRNNRNGNIGFASKPNRINVAFSRARGLLCVVGSEDTFCYGEGKSRARERAREIYKSAYHACDKAGGCISESELRGKFGLDELNRKWGGHGHAR